ncbi:MAG: rhomboid family intramembrane serine protease [Planctomycetota bacterium]
MGIHDRSYYKDDSRGAGSFGSGFGGGGWGAMRPKKLSVTLWLIILNTAVFFIDLSLPMVDIRDVVVYDSAVPSEILDRSQVVEVQRPANVVIGLPWQKPVVDPVTNAQVGYEQFRTWHALNGYGHFSLLHGFLRLEVWRLVTFQFLHADLTHWFFNMFGLFIFGRMVEDYLGRSRYLSFYLICGMAGGLLYMLFAGLASLGVPLPGTLAFTGAGTPLIGASAGVFGVVVACARIAPDMRVMLLFPPIPLKMAWIAYAYVGISAFNLLLGGANAGGDAAHLGGAIAGFYFIRRQHLLRGFLDFQLLGGRKKQGGSARPKPRMPNRTSGKDQKEIDRILAKVSAEGLHSLSSREKKTLERASRDARDSR